MAGAIDPVTSIQRAMSTAHVNPCPATRAPFQRSAGWSPRVATRRDSEIVSQLEATWGEELTENSKVGLKRYDLEFSKLHRQSLRPPAPAFGRPPDQDVLAWTDGRRVAEVCKFGTDARSLGTANDVVSFKLSCQHMPVHCLSLAPPSERHDVPATPRCRRSESATIQVVASREGVSGGHSGGRPGRRAPTWPDAIPTRWSPSADLLRGVRGGPLRSRGDRRDSPPTCAGSRPSPGLKRSIALLECLGNRSLVTGARPCP